MPINHSILGQKKITSYNNMSIFSRNSLCCSKTWPLQQRNAHCRLCVECWKALRVHRKTLQFWSCSTKVQQILNITTSNTSSYSFYWQLIFKKHEHKIILLCIINFEQEAVSECHTPNQKMFFRKHMYVYICTQTHEQVFCGTTCLYKK